MSIRTRLLLLILLAILIPAAVGGGQFLLHRNAEIAAAHQDLAAAVKQVESDLKDVIKGTAQLQYGLSRARDFDTEDRAVCSEFLANVLKEHPQYTGLLTIKPNGELFCDSLRTGRVLNLTDRRYFQEALKSKSSSVEPTFGRLTGTAVMQVAYAARRETGEPKFVLLASLNLERYMQSRSKSLPREHAVVALVDDKGTILTRHPAGERLKGNSIADSPLFRFAQEYPDGSAREFVETDGTSRIWAVGKLPESGLHVLIGASRKDLLAAADQNLRRALTILGIVSLLALAGAWALAELGVRRQLARVITAVARFGEGDLGVRIGKPLPRGEIGDLMVALDRAFELMQTQREAIQRLNTDLERRVTERTTQLETSVKELENFTYIVSHDLRTPLRAIDGFSLILVEDYGAKLDDEAQRLIDTVRNNAKKMGQLIDDLLIFSRLGRNPVSATEVDMEALARSALAEIPLPETEKKSLIEIHSMPKAWSDPNTIKQVWINLLSNAIKFSSKRKQPLIEISGYEENAECIYSVSDNGTGFDMKYYNKLFGVFQRLHGVEEFPGTGVGLAIVRRIVSRHGGRVWAKGRVDEGATFYFSLPKGSSDGGI